LDSFSGYKSDANAFVFSLTNKDNKPVKKKIDPNENEYAIICDFEYGPTFGSDIKIDNNANSSINSSSNLEKSYRHPQYSFGTKEASIFMAGSYEFQLDQIEVYQKE
jgi:hypothetical protein